MLRFVEPYRDPLGVRAEFEGIVGIADTAETSGLHKLASTANSLAYRLPWVEGHGELKGPFEKEMFEPPDFSSVQSRSPHVLAERHELTSSRSRLLLESKLPGHQSLKREKYFKFDYRKSR